MVVFCALDIALLILSNLLLKADVIDVLPDSEPGIVMTRISDNFLFQLTNCSFENGSLMCIALRTVLTLVALLNKESRSLSSLLIFTAQPSPAGVIYSFVFR